MTPLAIVGSGRSGSGYISAVLTHAGVPCGHEQWWNPWDERTPGLIVDSSWIALSHGLQGARALHQVRHPLAVVSSLVASPTTPGPYLEAQTLIVSRRLLNVPADPVLFAMAAWVCSLREAEAVSDWGWKVEDVDARLVSRIAAWCGQTVPVDVAQSAVDAVPQDHNRHHDTPLLGWDDLPRGPIFDALVDDARRWGYQ